MGLKEKQLASLFDQGVQDLNAGYGAYLKDTYGWAVTFAYDATSIPNADRIMAMDSYYTSSKGTNIVVQYLKMIAEGVVIRDIAKMKKPADDSVTWGELLKIKKINFIFGAANSLTLADGVLTVTDDVLTEPYTIANGRYKHQKKMSDELLNLL